MSDESSSSTSPATTTTTPAGGGPPTRTLAAVAVYCGSSTGKKECYVESARAFGSALAARKATLVYGGGSTGMMGAVASATLRGGAAVVGVIPHALQKFEAPLRDERDAEERTMPGTRTTLLVASMHERKLEMMRRADAFVALPGGFGTLEELFEVITWLQLGIHAKPVGVLNTDGYYAPLLAMIADANAAGFVGDAAARMLCVADTPDALLDKLAAVELPKGVCELHEWES